MIGIYEDKFIDYLKEHSGCTPKIRSKNIVIRCPWCETGSDKTHYHLWIGIEAPIFRCFGGGCGHKGFISKLINYLSGSDVSERYINKELVKENVKKQIVFKRNKVEVKEIELPDLKETGIFNYKARYIKERFKFSNVDIKTVKGLIFDVHEFIRVNNIQVDMRLNNLMGYLQTNFVGFLTEHKSVAIFRNVDRKSDFRHFKLDIQPSKFLDYYKLPGAMKFSKNIILGEGIFDIYSEHIFDSLNLKNKSSLYACGLSVSYPALLKSICYHEQIFKPDVHIISDNGIHMNYYNKLKKYNPHLLNTLNVYFNKMGKDFNDNVCIPERVYRQK